MGDHASFDRLRLAGWLVQQDVDVGAQRVVDGRVAEHHPSQGQCGRNLSEQADRDIRIELAEGLFGQITAGLAGLQARRFDAV